MAHQRIKEAPMATFLFHDTKAAWGWFLVRLYVGWQWLEAGLDKINDSAWTGQQAGASLHGFIENALRKTVGEHPDVQGWYASFLENVVLPHAGAWSHVIAWGEMLVGVALLAGAFVGVAAFFGLFMNFNYMLAGTVSSNPILFVLSIGLVLAWRVAGHIGFDRVLIREFGTLWSPGNIFNNKKQPDENV